MSRYPHEKLSEKDNTSELDNSTIKAICSNIQIPAYIEVINASAVNILDITENPGQPFAQIEAREIRQQQRQDPILGKWVIAVMDKQLPSKNIQFQKDDNIMKKNFNHFKSIRGILYRQIKDGDKEVTQLVLPDIYEKQVLKGMHNDVDHPERDRTISVLRFRFYWPGITVDIENWVNSCERCLRRKTSTHIRAPLVNFTTTYPLELVAMDFLTVEPSKSGIESILVITVHFTKYALAIPCRHQTAKTTAEALYNQFIVHYGIPTRIHSGQGTNFESEIIKKLCLIMGIQKSRTTPYHAMCNGLAKRYNRTLLNMLGTLEPDKKTDWKKYIPSLVFEYNCTVEILAF